MSRDAGPHNAQKEPGQDEAARRLQKLWRGRNDAKDQFLTSQARWDEVVGDMALKAAGDGAGKGDNSQRARWGRAGKYAMRLQDPDAMMAGAGTDVPGAARKNLETQHWLELIDGKHRYGSNLKYYFARWKEADTEDNFFNWLDNGDGKGLDLKECSREQLEKERIYYLTNEQRLNYLVQIDDKGRLCWAKNNEPVDTSPGQWKDAGDGKGIVPMDSEDHPELEQEEPSGLSSPGSLAVNHYVEPPQGNSKLTTSVKRNLTLKGLVNKLLRKTLQKNTWIYVSDKNYNIFIGIKRPGTFQHSSFLAGGKVTSAGLISVKDGVIHTLSPLSGHYRTSINHFHQFLDVLDKKGVDISHVKKTKAEVALWTLEHVAKAKKKKGAVVTVTKEKVKDLVEHNSAGTDVDDEESDEDTGWKQEILHGRKKEGEEDHDAERPIEHQGGRKEGTNTATAKPHSDDAPQTSSSQEREDTSPPQADSPDEHARHTEETPPETSGEASAGEGPPSDNMVFSSAGEGPSPISPHIDNSAPSTQTD